MTSVSTFEYYPASDQNGSPRLIDGETRRRYSTGWPSSGRGSQKPLGLKLKGMKYEEIKAMCLKEGKLFEDPDFDAVDSILYYDSPTDKRYVWQRPKEILGGSGSPEFFVDDASRFDIEQHGLGDCWMLAAMSCLSMRPELMKKVVPDGQNFKYGDYAGIFRFNFWKFGKWVEVIIDDRLPTDNNKLAYTSSSQKNEFWTALLEKAYAKFHGSYKAIDGGQAIKALEDFTGGIGETFRLGPKAPPTLLSIMLQAHKRDSLMCCSIDSDNTIKECHLSNGLIMGHAYSVTGVNLVKTQQFGSLPMVRLRNPWGDDAEWNGDWSDKSSTWKSISESEKQRIGLVSKYDGEFWMSYEDFVENYQWLNICHLDPESFTDDAVALKQRGWATTFLKGCWVRGTSAGGDLSSPNFWTNPQCGFEVVDVDKGDNKDSVTVIIALMQREGRKELAQIGYAIYQLQNPLSAPLGKHFNHGNFINKPLRVSEDREVCSRHELSPGSYCVVPFAKCVNQEGDFILRLFAETPVTSRELDEPTGMRDIQFRGLDERPERRPVGPPVKSTREGLGKNEDMLDTFKKIAGQDLEIDACELQEFLSATFRNDIGFGGFSSETCRSLVALKDVDRSGKLGYREFVTLWILLQKWKTAFKNHDVDGNGTFDSFELRQALRDMGYSVSNQTFNALVRRYSRKDGKIYFDDFIHCIARLSTMFEVFDEMNHGRGDSDALFNRDQFIQTTMYS